MFKRSNEKITPEDLNMNLVIYQIYSLITNWLNVEEENAKKGREDEQRWLLELKQFNFLSLSRFDTDQQCIDVLQNFFIPSPAFYLPSRMQLLTAQLTLQFGPKVVETINKRLVSAFSTVWKCNEKRAKLLVKEYPCLWVMFIAQAFPLLPNMRLQ